MPQIKSFVCRQACVACWSDVIVKNDETSMNPFSNAFQGSSGQKNIQVFSQPGQSDFMVIVIRAE